MISEKQLADALQAALDAGAQYAEARAEDGLLERIHVRNGSAETLATDHDEGWGIHALVDGGWGFASTVLDTPEAVTETAQRAVEIARASATRSTSDYDLSGLPVEKGEYASDVAHDPAAMPFSERVDMIVEVTGRVRQARPAVQVATGSLHASRTDKRFLNTLGADLRQSITFVGGWIAAIARDDTGYSYRRSYGDMKQGGWEHIMALDLPENAGRVGWKSGELVAAPWALSVPQSVILNSVLLVYIVHYS